MAASPAARRYANALFSLAREESKVTEVREELSALSDLFETNEELRSALLTPLHPVKERKAALQAIAQKMELSGLLKNFYAFLADRRRLVNFAGIRDEYERLADEASGLLTAEVVSSRPLDERRKDRLRRALSERTGREVKLEIHVDPELIGGAIAKVGDLVFDGSLRTQLSQLSASLTKGS
jgi:F-type H+-transporting ATPase subunit delta